jgi:hypothetical protein
MSQADASEAERVRELYRYAAELMKAGRPVAEIRLKLLEKGLNEESAVVVINSLVALRSRARVEAGRRNILRGALWCVGGIVVTAGTYLLAAPGETYIVAWGAIVFGAIQFIRGCSQSGMQAAGVASFCIMGAVGLLGCLSLIYFLLSNVWTGYKDEQLGFAVSYPILWKVEVQEQEGIHKVSFVPRQGSGQHQRQLAIWVEPDTDAGGTTTCDTLSALKVKALGQTNARLGTSRPRCIDSRPASEIAFQWGSSEEPITAWLALVRLRGTLCWLTGAEAGGEAGLLEPLYNRFVNSFRFGPSFPKPEPCPTSSPLQCHSGYDSYSDAELGFSVCYPAQWVAVCEPEDQSAPRDRVMFASPVSSDEEYISLLFDREPSGIDRLSDEQWAQLGFDYIVKKQANVVSFPRVSTLDGRRCLHSVWETAESRDGKALLETNYLAWLVDGERTWFITISGPSDRVSYLDSTYREFAASFHVLP